MVTLSKTTPGRNGKHGLNEAVASGEPLTGAVSDDNDTESCDRLPPTAPSAGPPNGVNPAKRLSQVIDAARPWFLAIEVDDEVHVARGIIPDGHGPSCVATLSYDPNWGLLRIDVRIRCRCRSAEQHNGVCLGRLNAHTRLTRLWWDPEDGLLWLRAASVCSRLDDDARFVFRKVAREVHCVLRDDALQRMLSEDPDSEAGSRAKGGNVR